MGNQWETTCHYMISSPWNAMGNFWKLDCVSLFDFEGYGISASQGHLRPEFGWRNDNDETLHDSNYMCSKQCHLSFLVAFSLCGGGSWHTKECFGMGNLWETYGKLMGNSKIEAHSSIWFLGAGQPLTTFPPASSNSPSPLPTVNFWWKSVPSSCIPTGTIWLQIRSI